MGVVTMLIIWLLLPLKHVSGDFKTKLRQMDTTGSILALAMTICFLVPLAGGGSSLRWDSPVVISLFVVSGVLAALFFVVEGWLAKLPLLPGRMFKNRNIALLLGQTFLVGICYFGNIYMVPLYLQNVLGASEIKSAALLLPLVLVQTFTTTLSGYVLKWTNRTRASFFVGFILWCAGQAGQVAFSRTTSVGVIVGVLLIQGLGIGATLQSTLVLIQVSGPSEDRAVVTGARNFVRSLGGAIGLAVGNTLVNNLFVKNLPPSLPDSVRDQLQREFVLPDEMSQDVKNQVLDAYMDGMRAVFIFFVPVVAVCLLLCFFIEDLPLSTPEPSSEPSSSGSSDTAVDGDDEKGLDKAGTLSITASVSPVELVERERALSRSIEHETGPRREGEEGATAGPAVESDRSPV
ncbi:hypothetical protein JCM8208_002458 [Rhodotorula glutinis]